MNLKQKTIYFILFIVITVYAQGQDVVSIIKNNGEVNFDGVPDEAFWQSAQKFDMVMHAPNNGEAPSENSAVYISYDDNFLWVSARLDYNDPTNIVSTSKKRDEESKNPDSFGILLDTYDDNENALAFFTMPEGQRIDFAVSNDAQMVPSFYGSTNINYSWNTFWDVKTARSDDGWAVEMRIPFSSLRFQVIDDKVKMGLLINRTISHCNEIDTYPELDPRHGMLAPNKPSLAQTIVFSGLKEVKPVYISPYIITGTDKLNELNDAETDFNYSEDKTLTGGLDVKYSLTSNVTMDLSINTDFAQVEADDEMVNLTRYALFYPEKRMFFQERSSIFNFSLGGPSQLFYSRRIGIDDDGVPVPIHGGARLTGRMGKWDIGFMDMQTRKTDDLVSENFGVLRFRRQVFNANSYIGAIITSRISADSINQYSYGIDGIFRVFGDDYAQFNIAQTTDSVGNNFSGSFDPAFFSISWERRSQKGIAYDLSYSYSGKDFDPQVGFMSRYGLKGLRLRLQYGWLPGTDSELFSYSVSFFANNSKRVTDNGLESAMYGPGISFMTKRGWSGRISLFYSVQGIDEEFELADNVVVPVNEYRYFTSRSTLSSPMSKPISTMLTLSAGEFYDGNNFTVTAQPIFNISSSVQITGYYNFNHVVFPARNQELNAHVGRIKVLYMYNTKLSASAFVQYNSIENLTVSNFRLRYNPKEGNDLYLVYNEIRPTKNYFKNGLPKINLLSQIIQVKYVHTFRL